MGISMETMFEQSQWIAVWASMLLTALSIAIAITDSDRRRKRLLRDIQILEGVGDYGDPYSVRVLEGRIAKELESACKPQVIGTGSRVYFAFCFFIYLVSGVWAYLSQQNDLLMVIVACALLLVICIAALSVGAKHAWEKNRASTEELLTDLTEQIRPSIRLITKCMKKGMSVETIERTVFAGEHAAEMYSRLLARSPADRRYVKEIVYDAIKDLPLDENEVAEAQSYTNTVIEASVGEGNRTMSEAPAAVDQLEMIRPVSGTVSEREWMFFNEMDGCMAELIPLVQDMRDAVDQASYDEHFDSYCHDYVELSLKVRDVCLRYDPYLDQRISELFKSVVAKMRESTAFWSTQVAMLANGEDAIDREKAFLACDELLAAISTARTAQSYYCK